MTPKKIKVISLSKPDDYVDREWAEVLSKRHYLLTVSDWTQLEDNELTFESRVRWNLWRNRVRAVRRVAVVDKDVAANLLTELEADMPDREFIASTSVRQKKYQIDISTIDQARSDAMQILKTLHHDWTINLLPENLNLINAKFEEVLRYNLSVPKPRSMKEYPLIETTRSLYEWTRADTIEHICTLKRLSVELLVDVEKHRYKFTKEIEAAQSIDTIISIIKNMHGY